MFYSELPRQPHFLTKRNNTQSILWLKAPCLDALLNKEGEEGGIKD